MDKKKKKKLGRGLGALIPVMVKPKPAAGGITHIDLEKIKPNPYQPRKDFNPERLRELVESIKEKGVLEPVILRPSAGKDGYYELITGERRFRAAGEAGLTEIPAIIKEVEDTEMLEIALVENLQREDLNPIEEANGYQVLLEKFSYTQEELARKMGKDRATIANTLRLLKLPGEIKEYISNNVLTEGHGRAIVSLDSEPLQLSLARKVVKRGLSVREVERTANKLKSTTVAPKPSAQKDIHILDLEEELTELFGTKVKIRHRGKRGKIQIEYYSEDEFQRLLEKFRKF